MEKAPGLSAEMADELNRNSPKPFNAMNAIAVRGEETRSVQPPAREKLMAAASIVAPERVEVARIAAPEPGENEVRVRLEGCGVCGSNLAPWEGRPWFK